MLYRRLLSLLVSALFTGPSSLAAGQNQINYLDEIPVHGEAGVGGGSIADKNGEALITVNVSSKFGNTQRYFRVAHAEGDVTVNNELHYMDLTLTPVSAEVASRSGLSAGVAVGRTLFQRDIFVDKDTFVTVSAMSLVTGYKKNLSRNLEVSIQGVVDFLGTTLQADLSRGGSSLNEGRNFDPVAGFGVQVGTDYKRFHVTLGFRRSNVNDAEMRVLSVRAEGDTTSQNAFAELRYDLSDHISLFVKGIWSYYSVDTNQALREVDGSNDEARGFAGVLVRW